MESNNALDSASTDSIYSMKSDKKSRSNFIKFLFHCKCFANIGTDEISSH